MFYTPQKPNRNWERRYEVGDIRTAKDKADFANLQRFWRLLDARIFPKGERTVSLFPLSCFAVGGPAPSMLYMLSGLRLLCNSNLLNVSYVRWEHEPSLGKVRRWVSGAGSCPLTEIIAHSLSFRFLLKLAGQVCKKQGGG